MPINRLSSKKSRLKLVDYIFAIFLAIILNLFIFLGMPKLSETSYTPKPLNIPLDAIYLTQIKPQLQKLTPSVTHINKDKPIKKLKVFSVKNVNPIQTKKISFSPPAFDFAPKLSMNLAVCVPASPKNTTNNNLGNISGGKPVKGSAIFSLGQVDNGPVLLVRIDPIYPYWARIRGIEGKVLVQIVVDQHGQVKDIKIIKAKPPHVFENSVINAVKKWRFKPATYHGKAVSVRLVIPFKFKLEQDQDNY